MLGRRGPAQAAFTSAELRELGNLRRRRAARRATSRSTRCRATGSTRRGRSPRARTSQLLQEFAAAPGAGRRRAPIDAALPDLARGDPRRRPRRGDRRRPQRDRARRRRGAARPGRRRRRRRRSSAAWCCAPSATAPCRSPTCRSTSATYVLPNERGPRADAGGRPLPGVYAVGWIKRGPTGILGTNKRDAEETSAAWSTTSRLPRRPTRSARASTRCSRERKPDLVTRGGWRAIAPIELERGRASQRPRVKLASRDELLDAAGTAPTRRAERLPPATSGAGFDGRPTAQGFIMSDGRICNPRWGC